MRSDTQSVTLPADHVEVYSFLSNPENLPQWAVGFCRRIRRDADRWLVDTGHGEVPMRYVTDATLGVIDFHFSPAPEVEERVAADGEEPAAAVGAGREGVPAPERPEEGLLHQVVGIGLIPGQRQREPRHAVEVRECGVFEACHLPPSRGVRGPWRRDVALSRG